MTTRATFFVTCDLCGESQGYSHNEETARAEVRRFGWVRIRNAQGQLVDLCRRCVERESDEEMEMNEVQP